jgi:hypothetical protein
MTVNRDRAGHITLEGKCGAEEAETLLQMLLETPEAPLNWSGCGELHTAVVQVILAANPRFSGPCGDIWLRTWFAAPHTVPPNKAVVD